MQSLFNLTADQLIKKLPRDCLDKLFERYAQERVFDLYTYQETETPPKDCYFIVYGESYGTYVLLGVTTHPTSLAFIQQYTTLPYINAYWLPKTGYNDIIYVPKLYELCKVTMTLRDLIYYEGTSYTPGSIRETARRSIQVWQRNGSPPNHHIRYFIPKQD